MRILLRLSSTQSAMASRRSSTVTCWTRRPLRCGSSCIFAVLRLMKCRMAQQGVFLTPTLSCYGIMVRKPFENFLPPSGQIKNAQVMEKGLEALKVGSTSISEALR